MTRYILHLIHSAVKRAYREHPSRLGCEVVFAANQSLVAVCADMCKLFILHFPLDAVKGRETRAVKDSEEEDGMDAEDSDNYSASTKSGKR
jgi:hypothetical protein